MARLPLFALTALLALSGCLSGSGPDAPEGTTAYAPLSEAVFNTTGSYSQPLEAGPYGYAEPVLVEFPSFDGTLISLGIHRPLIPGCPEELAGAFRPECRTPVLMDAGPYFTPDSVLQLSTRPPTGIWYVPHGYTMIYMAVRGTGGSGGCMEYMSLNEQKDVDAVVTWAGGQAWSTGNVGLIGRSYDGTTPWFPAAMGNPHLKTIVPISGITDMADLMFANGTSELRGPIMASYVYWVNYGLGPEPIESAPSQACPEVVKGAVVGPYTTETGDRDVAGLDDYWAVRDWSGPVLDNYDGSVFIIHGLLDWNVNPRMVVPYIQELQDHGIRTKAWLGQWGHAYPDRADEHPNVRWDWSEVLLRWLDHELKGADVDTGPAVEVEDHRHSWWVADSYPPRHVNVTDVPLTGAQGGEGQAPCPAAGGPSASAQASTCVFTTDVIPGPVRISGLVRLGLSVTPMTPTGGTVYAELYDVYPDGRSVWIGHAWMNLRYHDGGHEAQALVPGVPVLARMQFEPLEAYLPADHQLRLVISQDVPAADGVTGANGAVDTLPRPEQGPYLVNPGESVLRLPLLREFTPSPYATYTLDRDVSARTA